jgi:hypothetical protein
LNGVNIGAINPRILSTCISAISFLQIVASQVAYSERGTKTVSWPAYTTRKNTLSSTHLVMAKQSGGFVEWRMLLTSDQGFFDAGIEYLPQTKPVLISGECASGL